MAQQTELPKQASAKASALTLTLLYVSLAGAWIAGSTPLLHYLLPRATADQLGQYEIGKGLLFVAVTAVFLFLLIYRRLLTLIASQEAVRLSEQRYRELVKTAEEGVWIIDVSEKTTFANDKLAELLGYSPQEMLDQPLERFADADTFKLIMSDIGRSRQGIRQQRDLRFRRKDGADLWTIVSSTPIYDDHGQYAGVLATITDITARKQAETLLAEAEAKYRALVENSHVGVYILQDGLTVYINPRITEMLGYTAQDLCGQPTLDIVAPEDRERIAARLGRRISGEEQATVPYSFGVIHKEGHRVDVEVLGSRMIYQGRPAIIGSMLDLTERKRAEQALRFTQFAMDRAADGIFWRDEQARFVYVNDAACRLLGYRREELLSMRVHDIAPDLSPEDWTEYFKRLNDRRYIVFETRHRTKDGRLFPVEVTSNLLEFDGREFVCAFARDITERRRLEEELRHSQKMEAIGRLAGGVAHDFNNLLAVISGYSESLLRHLRPDDRLRLHAEEIGKAADRGASLTRQLLAFSRRQVIKPQILDLNKIIRDLQEMLRRTIKKSITIELHLDTALGPIKADPGHMEQVLVNLALNARDAMEQSGGVLTIRTENTDVDHASTVPCNLPPGRYVKLSVHDTGCGMDPELQTRIFEPFFTTKAGKGTGLGLSIVYGIVQQAGGCIHIQSQPQKGATFHILLPRVEDDPSSTSANVP